MVNRSVDPIYDRLETAKKLLKTAKTSDEKLAIANYIANIYRSLVCMGVEDVSFDIAKDFGSKKNFQKFQKKLTIYQAKLMRQFVDEKDFHQNFLGTILPDVEEEMTRFCSFPFLEEEELRRDDFWDIFYWFLEELQLKDEFDAFYHDSHVHSSIQTTGENQLGFTTYNPVNRDVDLFARDFRYTLSCMETLAHEMGHGYDLKNFHGSVKEYNQYYYLSFYGEVLSRLMERLLHRFLLKHNIQIEATKERMIEFECLNYDFLLQSYILSLLDEDSLLKDAYKTCDKSVLIRKVRKYFMPDFDLKAFVERFNLFDVSEDFTYTYGDILSLFLCEEVEKKGFQGERFESFLRHRGESFHKNFLYECGVSPEKYVKLYQKEVQLIKK